MPVQSTVVADHKKAALEMLVATIPERATFNELGALLGYSGEWVRLRLITHPERLIKVGKRYWVPKGVAVDLIRAEFH